MNEIRFLIDILFDVKIFEQVRHGAKSLYLLIENS